MALTYPEALKMMGVNGNIDAARLIKSVVTVDALFSKIPLIATDQMTIPVPREGTEPTFGEFVSDTSSAAPEESTGTDDVVHVPLRTIIGDVDVQSMVSDFTPDAMEHQVRKKVKAQARVVSGKLITGAHTTSFTAVGSAAMAALDASGATFSPWLDSNRRGPGSIKYTHVGTLWQFRAPGDLDYGPAVEVTADGFATLTSHNPSYWIRVSIDVSDATADGQGTIVFGSTTLEADGIKRLIPTSQTTDPVGAEGDLFSLAKLDELLNLVKVGENPAFFMSGAFITLYKAILRSLGGATIETIMIPGYGKPVIAYEGIPILRNDNCTLDETVGSTATGSVYLANLDATEGLALGVGNPRGGSTVDPQTDPYKSPMLGWKIEDLGTRVDRPRTKTRVTFYGAPILKSVLAAARARGIRNAIS